MTTGHETQDRPGAGDDPVTATTSTGRSAGRAEAEYTGLYLRQHRTVTWIVAARVRRFDHADVEDLVQVVFLRAWTAWPQFCGTTAAEEQACLGTIARRAVCDHYRKGPGPQRAVEQPTGPEHPLWWSDRHAAEPDPADRICVRVDTTASLRAAGTEHRHAVQLRIVEEQSWAQAASRMRRGKATVRRMVAETLALLADTTVVVEVRAGVSA